jgi:hypothetical protein
MSWENRLWDARCIHGELAMLGVRVSRITVAKYIARRPGSPSHTWRTFLRNDPARSLPAVLTRHGGVARRPCTPRACVHCAVCSTGSLRVGGFVPHSVTPAPSQKRALTRLSAQSGYSTLSRGSVCISGVHLTLGPHPTMMPLHLHSTDVLSHSSCGHWHVRCIGGASPPRRCDVCGTQ